MTTTTIELPASTLTKSQRHKYGPKVFTEHGESFRITAEVRHDDQCGNGHNSFAITAEIYQKDGHGRWVDYSGGCCHDEIAKHFPELAPFIKWHLTSADGPMHYPGNVTYLAGERDCWGCLKARELDAARHCAVWPDATDEDLTAPGLEQRLMDRLPALMAEFKTAMESLGFVY